MRLDKDLSYTLSRIKHTAAGKKSKKSASRLIDILLPYTERPSGIYSENGFVCFIWGIKEAYVDLEVMPDGTEYKIITRDDSTTPPGERDMIFKLSDVNREWITSWFPPQFIRGGKVPDPADLYTNHTYWQEYDCPKCGQDMDISPIPKPTATIVCSCGESWKAGEHNPNTYASTVDNPTRTVEYPQT